MKNSGQKNKPGKGRNQLAESSEEFTRNKKEQTTSEKLQEKLEPLSPCPMSDE